VKKIIFLWLFSIFVLISCKEDTNSVNLGIISGKVLNAKDNSPVSGVLITTEPPSQTLLTDAGGKFSIIDVSPGDVFIRATKTGYKSNSVTINVKANKTTSATILLTDNLTENRPPDRPSSPNPDHRSEINSTPVTLQWNCADPDGDLIKYDVYFDKVNPPLTKIGSEILNTDIDAPALEDSTTYYWKIVAKDPYNASVEGDIWRFTVIKDMTPKPDGLIAYWSFDNQTVMDGSGNGYNGAMFNNPTFVAGKKGKAISLVSLGDQTTNGSYVTLPAIPFNSYSEFSICLWVYEKSMAGGGGSYICFGDENYGKLSIDHESWRPDVYTNKLQFSVGAAWNDIQYPNYYITPLLIDYDISGINKWVHYAMTYSNGSLKAYRNGVKIGTLSQNIKVSTTKAGLGIIYWNNGSSAGTRFTGYLDEVRIYNKELTLSEISNLAK